MTESADVEQVGRDEQHHGVEEQPLRERQQHADAAARPDGAPATHTARNDSGEGGDAWAASGGAVVPAAGAAVASTDGSRSTGGSSHRGPSGEPLVVVGKTGFLLGPGGALLAQKGGREVECCRLAYQPAVGTVRVVYGNSGSFWDAFLPHDARDEVVEKLRILADASRVVHNLPERVGDSPRKLGIGAHTREVTALINYLPTDDDIIHALPDEQRHIMDLKDCILRRIEVAKQELEAFAGLRCDRLHTREAKQKETEAHLAQRLRAKHRSAAERHNELWAQKLAAREKRGEAWQQCSLSTKVTIACHQQKKLDKLQVQEKKRDDNLIALAKVKTADTEEKKKRNEEHSYMGRVRHREYLDYVEQKRLELQGYVNEKRAKPTRSVSPPKRKPDKDRYVNITARQQKMLELYTTSKDRLNRSRDIRDKHIDDRAKHWSDKTAVRSVHARVVADGIRQEELGKTLATIQSKQDAFFNSSISLASQADMARIRHHEHVENAKVKGRLAKLAHSRVDDEKLLQVQKRKAGRFNKIDKLKIITQRPQTVPPLLEYENGKRASSEPLAITE